MYSCSASIGDALELYVVQAVGHHVMAAGRCAQLEPLLCNPSWLEHKLHAYGVTSIVADFRRCKMLPPQVDQHAAQVRGA